MSPYLMTYLIIYMSSFFFVINSDDWFLIWLGMEINMLSFIFIVFDQESMENIESCFKYFFIQGLGSALFLSVFYLNKDSYLYLSSIILSYKMGAGPFFFWFPAVCGGLGWGGCFFLMTFQKVIPLMLMEEFKSLMIWMILMLSLLIGAMGSFNQSEMKRLLAFSSIHHIGWILICMMVKDGLWMEYLMLYGMVIFPLLYILWKSEMSSVMSLLSWSGKWSMLFLMLSMGGMPPFLGFFLKWISFYYMMSMGIEMIIFMILMSVVMFYVYIRIIYDLILGCQVESSWLNGKEMMIWKVYNDVMGVMGVLVGCVVGVLLVM